MCVNVLAALTSVYIPNMCALRVQKVLPDALQQKLTLTDGNELLWECYLLSFFSSSVMKPFKFTGANLPKVLD